MYERRLIRVLSRPNGKLALGVPERTAVPLINMTLRLIQLYAYLHAACAYFVEYFPSLRFLWTFNQFLYSFRIQEKSIHFMLY